MPLLGGDGWDSDQLLEIGGEALEGCYYSNHYSLDAPTPALQKFVADYKAKYNAQPDALGGLGYDAANLLLDGSSASTPATRPRSRRSTPARPTTPRRRRPRAPSCAT